MAIMQFKDTTYHSTKWFTFDGLVGWVRVVDVHDGDTITIIMSHDDNGKVAKHRVRLNGIDAYEVTSPVESLKHKALLGRNRIIQLVTNNFEINYPYTRKDIIERLNSSCYMVWIECGGFDKFGRMLAQVYESDDKIVNFATVLLNEGLAYSYAGGHKPDLA